MAIRPLIKTECYLCNTEIMATEQDVHPLCVTCQDRFDEWFATQIQLFDRGN